MIIIYEMDTQLLLGKNPIYWDAEMVLLGSYNDAKKL